MEVMLWLLWVYLVICWPAALAKLLVVLVSFAIIKFLELKLFRQSNQNYIFAASHSFNSVSSAQLMHFKSSSR